MAEPLAPSTPSGNRLTRWLLEHRIEQAPGSGARESEREQHPSRRPLIHVGGR